MFSNLDKLAGAALVATALLSAGSAMAGIVITDGRTGASLMVEVDPTTQQPVIRTLTPKEQQLYVFASAVFNGHDAAVECGEECATDEGEAAGCQGAPASLLATVLSGVALLRRKRKA